MMWIDNHCDALTKIYLNPELEFRGGKGLDVTLERLGHADVRLQCFAIYMPASIAEPRMEHVLAYIRLFHVRILCHPEMVFVRTGKDLELAFRERRTGAMLTLEGADALQGNLAHVETLYRLGVRCLGLTWNFANWAADGIQEPRQAALSLKGRQLVDLCNETGMILDVSHLSEPGFWELCERTRKPFLASHANAYTLCPHPRNLKDDQIRALIKAGGLMGLAFVPDFLNADGDAGVSDLLKHIDHIAALGGERVLCFGSDFDGIDNWVRDLEHPGKLSSLREILLKHYPNEFVERLCWKNAYQFYLSQLPAGE